MPYISSIISKYGDPDNASADSQKVMEIIHRQGSTFLIDVLAEYTADQLWSWKLNDSERQKTVNSLVAELKNALNERT